MTRVHHVRSNDVNIAVNIWWRHGVDVNFINCDARPGRTIKDLNFIGFGALHEAQKKLIRSGSILNCWIKAEVTNFLQFSNSYSGSRGSEG